MAELIGRLRPGSRPLSSALHGDAWWVVLVGLPAAVALAWALTFSLQAACAFVAVVAVVALHQYDRRLGIFALFALWLVAPGLRRVVGLETGFVENDPLSLAPFLATGAVAALELLRFHVPGRIRRVFLAAAAGFALGLPMGLLMGPRAAIFAFVAYLAGVAGAALGLGERISLQNSTLRRVLLYGLVPIAIYGILQRLLQLPPWDQAWIDSTRFNSIGTGGDLSEVRVFGTLNSPGTLAALLGLSLLCYLTVQRARAGTIAAAVILWVAFALTSVRSAWVAIIVAGLAHVIASRGQSARLVLGTGAVVVLTTLALAPVNSTAREVVDRFKSITDRADSSGVARTDTFTQTLPIAASAPIGHGLGTAGEPSKLSGDSFLRAPDNGYLGLMYQVGPFGFLLVVGALAYILLKGWQGARARAPGQELRLLLFAMLVYLAVLLGFGDAFYASSGVILWFIGGQVLAFDYRRRAAQTSG